VAPGRVTFAGQVEPPRVAALLRQADVLVLPNTPGRVSAAYTSPLKLFEYMASGRPIVASDLPALREVLRPDVNAVLVEAGSAEALAAGLSRVIGDAALASRLAAQARDDVRAWTWDKRAERIETLLESVTGRLA
jgi:glycosyltransferase involved in cell wall biosynthesis